MSTPPVKIVLDPLAGQTRAAPVAVLGSWLRQTPLLPPIWTALDWPRKVYDHTVGEQIETLLVSMRVGNRAVYQLATTIRPDRPLARAWGQAHLPQQSTSAAMLNRVTAAQVAQVPHGSAVGMQQHRRVRQPPFDAHWLLVDYATTGVLAAKTAEGRTTGGFAGPRHR